MATRCRGTRFSRALLMVPQGGAMCTKATPPSTRRSTAAWPSVDVRSYRVTGALAVCLLPFQSIPTASKPKWQRAFVRPAWPQHISSAIGLGSSGAPAASPGRPGRARCGLRQFQGGSPLRRVWSACLKRAPPRARESRAAGGKRAAVVADKKAAMAAGKRAAMATGKRARDRAAAGAAHKRVAAATGETPARGLRRSRTWIAEAGVGFATQQGAAGGRHPRRKHQGCSPNELNLVIRSFWGSP